MTRGAQTAEAGNLGQLQTSVLKARECAGKILEVLE